MSTEHGTQFRTRTIAAKEIKRRGIGVLDESLREGPIHVIRNDRLTYVVMLEEDYELLMEDAALAESVRVRESLQDYREGRFKRSTAEELIRDFGLRP
jgi:hypothetical protein